MTSLLKTLFSTNKSHLQLCLSHSIYHAFTVRGRRRRNLKIDEVYDTVLVTPIYMKSDVLRFKIRQMIHLSGLKEALCHEDASIQGRNVRNGA